MGASIASILVLGVLFAGMLIVFRTDMVGDFRAANSVQEGANLADERARTSLEIVSTNALEVFRCDTGVELTVRNNGHVPVKEFEQMDVLTWYTTEGGPTDTVSFDFSAGNLEKGQWSVGGISPNNASPWFEPGETATLLWRFLQPQQEATSAYLTVITPNGVADSQYVSFEDIASGDCRFLHNDPTPPEGDTLAHTILTFGTGLPAAVPLYNYDTDRDTDLGLMLVRSQNGLNETNPAKFQTWRTSPLIDPLPIIGDVLVDLWSSLSPPNLAEVGIVVVYLRDFDGTSYTEVGQGAIFKRDWQSGSTGLVERLALVQGVNYTLSAGHQLEIRIIVDVASQQDMRIAYDTKDYPSLLNLSFVPPAPSISLYLHNSPTPPEGDTSRQEVLPIESTIPTSGTLYQYGAPNNNDGLLLKGTDQGLSETNPSKYQVWRTGTLASPLSIEGDVLIDIWASIRQFQTGQSGAVTAYLRDYDGAVYSEIANGSVFVEDWQEGSSSFLKRTIMIPNVQYTVPVGHELEARFIADTIKASKDMWFAYDTGNYPSVINIP
jgi:hypothetical protein